MRRLLVLLAVSVLGYAGVSAQAASPGFQYGVAAGEIRPTSAVLWTRAPAAGRVRVTVTARGSGGSVWNTRASGRDDETASVAVSGLEPSTTYTYVFREGGASSPAGTFTTAPGTDATRSVRFALSGDADATAGTNGAPGFNRYEVYGRMAAERNDFNVNLGDTIYSDSELARSPVARTVAQKWASARARCPSRSCRRDSR